MVHLDRIEGAKFRAQTAVHTNVNIDKELSGLGYRTTSRGIC